MAILNETRTYRKIDRTLHGDTTYLRGIGEHGNVFSFCIGTPENPKGKELSPEENAERMKAFTDTLKRNRLHYYKAKGKYEGIKEHSLFIPNVNLKQCKHWFGPEGFNQNAFIYGQIDPKTHKVEYSYWDWNGREFRPVETKSEVIKTDDSDNFSNIANLKFRIPFFEEALNEVSNSLEEAYGWDENYRDYLFEIVNSDSSIPNLWRYACSHLLTEEQEARRKESLSKSIFKDVYDLREEVISLSKI